MKIDQLIAGNPPPAGRLQYRLLKERVERIVNDYANRTHLQYLRGLAHTFQL